MTARSATKNEAGVTLVELMIAGAVAGIVAGSVFGVMVTSSQHFAAQSMVAETQAAGRFGMRVVAQDLQSAANGATPNCENDASIPAGDRATSCQWTDAGGRGIKTRALFFDNHAAVESLGDAAAANDQFAPDELWIFANPFPGKRLSIEAQDGTKLLVKQPVAGAIAPTDALTYDLMGKMLSYGVLQIERRGARSLRLAPADDALEPGAGGASWGLTFDVEPACSLGQASPRCPYQGDGTVSAVAWTRYVLKVDPAVVGSDGRKVKVDLWREVHPTPSADPIAADIVAENVVDLQFSFCVDEAYDPNAASPVAPVIVCDKGAGDDATAEVDEAAINANPEKVRSATITLRVRSQNEDIAAAAVADQPLAWYDLNENPDDGVARVRTVVRKVTLASMASVGR